MQNNNTRTIIITGCSSGFGTVRKEDELEDAYKEHLTPVVCDITNADQVDCAARYAGRD